MNLNIIPAMDIINNKIVRLKQGSFSETTYYPYFPLDLAKNFEQIGLNRLHLVDLDGAKAGKFVHLGLLESLAKETSLKIDFSGGARTIVDVQQAFDCGASYVTLGSVAVKSFETVAKILNTFGPEKIIISADFKDSYVFTDAWLKESNISIYDLIKCYRNLGVKQFLCTSISNDGMLKGLNISAYRDILNQFPDLFLIASGGLASFDEFDLLSSNNIPAVVLGKAFYEGKITLKDLEQFLKRKN